MNIKSCNCIQLPIALQCIRCVLNDILKGKLGLDDSKKLILDSSKFTCQVDLELIINYLSTFAKNFIKLSDAERGIHRGIYEKQKQNPIQGFLELNEESNKSKSLRKITKKLRKTHLIKRFLHDYRERGVEVYEEVIKRKVLRVKKREQITKKEEIGNLVLIEENWRGPFGYFFLKGNGQSTLLKIKKISSKLGLDDLFLKKIVHQLDNSEMDILNMSFEEILETRVALAKSYLEKYLPNLGSEEIKDLSLELASTNTKIEEIFPFIYIESEINEVYGVYGRNLHIEHSELGKCLTEVKMDVNLVKKIESLISTDNYGVITYKQPSVKVDLIGKYYKARISYDAPPLSTHALDIRNLHIHKLTLPELIKKEMLNSEAASLLVWLIKNCTSILITGPTSSGKTTLANALLPFLGPDKRLISIEDVREIMDFNPYGVQHVLYEVPPLEIKTERESVKVNEIYKSLWRNPDFLYIGELRKPDEIEAFILSVESGIGSMATTHSKSLEELSEKWLKWKFSLNPVETIISLKKIVKGPVVTRRLGSICHPGVDEFKFSFKWVPEKGRAEKTIRDQSKLKPVKRILELQGLTKREFDDQISKIKYMLEDLRAGNLSLSELTRRIRGLEVEKTIMAAETH